VRIHLLVQKLKRSILADRLAPEAHLNEDTLIVLPQRRTLAPSSRID